METVFCSLSIPKISHDILGIVCGMNSAKSLTSVYVLNTDSVSDGLKTDPSAIRLKISAKFYAQLSG